MDDESILDALFPDLDEDMRIQIWRALQEARTDERERKYGFSKTIHELCNDKEKLKKENQRLRKGIRECADYLDSWGWIEFNVIIKKLKKLLEDGERNE